MTDTTEIPQLDIVEAAIDDLSGAPLLEVYRTLLPFDDQMVTAKAVKLALAGGGAAYAILREEQPSGTSGGAFSASDWQTRVLNAEVDPSGFVVLAANQFTLPAGDYLVVADAPAYQVGHHQLRLRNITDSTDDIIGGSGLFADPSRAASTRAQLTGRLSLAAEKTFELQHHAQFGDADGFGVAADFGVEEVYAQVIIYREVALAGGGGGGDVDGGGP